MDKNLGTVKFFKEDKGYGFITEDNGQDYFVHATGLLDEVRKGSRVSFDVAEGKKGKAAVNVSLVAE